MSVCSACGCGKRERKDRTMQWCNDNGGWFSLFFYLPLLSFPTRTRRATKKNIGTLQQKRWQDLLFPYMDDLFIPISVSFAPCGCMHGRKKKEKRSNIFGSLFFFSTITDGTLKHTHRDAQSIARGYASRKTPLYHCAMFHDNPLPSTASHRSVRAYSDSSPIAARY